MGEHLEPERRMSEYNPEETWYLAQLKPNSARIAERNLTRQGFRTFLPRHHETRRGSGKFATALKPLFPGYVFVAFDPMRGPWRAINATYGVSRLVCTGNVPQAVPDEIVSGLLARCDEAGVFDPASPFKPGDQVRIGAGPFLDFVASVEEMESDRRVWVLLELMGRQTRMALDPVVLRAEVS
jgi:transcriptional antiterminator RfaH